MLDGKCLLSIILSRDIPIHCLLYLSSFLFVFVISQEWLMVHEISLELSVQQVTFGAYPHVLLL